VRNIRKDSLVKVDSAVRELSERSLLLDLCQTVVLALIPTSSTPSWPTHRVLSIILIVDAGHEGMPFRVQGGVLVPAASSAFWERSQRMLVSMWIKDTNVFLVSHVV